MNIETLRYLLTTAETGSISSAAKTLFMSQQGLNKSITSLEQEIGYTLFERGKQGVTLTEEGRTVERYARHIVELVDRMEDDLRRKGEGEKAIRDLSVKIAATRICIHTILQPLVERGFLSNTLITEASTDSILELVRDGDWIGISDLIPKKYSLAQISEELECHQLLTTKFGIIYRKNKFPDIPRTITADFAETLPLAINNSAVLAEMIANVFGTNNPKGVIIRTASMNLLIKAMSEGSCVILGDSYFWHKSARPLGKPDDKIVFSQIEDFEVPIVVMTSKDADEDIKRFVAGFTTVQAALDAEDGLME